MYLQKIKFWSLQFETKNIKTFPQLARFFFRFPLIRCFRFKYSQLHLYYVGHKKLILFTS